MKTLSSQTISHFLRKPFLLLCLLTLSLAASFNAVSGGKIDDRVDVLLKQMTLEEKIGQMTQVDIAALKDRSDIQKYFLGSVLSGGGSDPADNSPATWLKLTQECQSWAAKTRLKIPLLYGIDAVHGHNNVDGAVIFPHNIGMGATRNTGLVEKAARVTAEEMAATGINWTFAPCVAVAQDAHWGRTYESYSDSPDVAGELGAAAVRGFQGNNFKDAASVLACAKHFVGDGGTLGGIDRGNTVADEATLMKLHLAPYKPALKGGVGSIMASFSSWNGVKMHGHKHLLTDVLKEELRFKGFIVSDWAAIDELPYDYKKSIEVSINAGLDMVMIPNGPGQPNNYIDFITQLTALVGENRVSMARIDDAVRRILRTKLQSGAFEQTVVAPGLIAAIGSRPHRDVARQCVQQSLVLLKNEQNALPLSKDFKRLCVIGKAADDLGIQCGGWTISWQGETGKVTSGGTTILQALRNTVSSNTVITYSATATNIERADVAIVVLGETPYAEMKGDRPDLRLPPEDIALIKKAKDVGMPVITVLLSGRPLVLGDALESSDAFVAAWLPGTEGQGVADVLLGDVKPTGKLPRSWPKETVTQLAQTNSPGKPLFPFGFGLSYNANNPTSGRIRTASAK